MEKTLPISQEGLQTAAKKASPSALRSISHVLFPCLIIFAAFRAFLYTSWFGPTCYECERGDSLRAPVPSCSQVPALHPSYDEDGRLQEMWEHLSSDRFRDGSIQRLSGAVQVPTQTYDDLGPIGEDYRWDVMYKFAEYLKTTYPRVHQHMAPERVNTHGLIFTLEGSDSKLKPLLLMAHQDVVPVPNDTLSAWTHPPFSGHYDGTDVWGRGSSDDKSKLIAIMETMEQFLKAGFKPKRTVILSFGFDEEVSGPQGAGHLAPHLLERYRENGLAAIVDEGAGYETVWGSVFAKPGTAEKGYTDVHITVRYPGGHSSIPTDHTSIGILSELITKIEAEQYTTYLADNNPYLEQLQCGSSYSPDFPKSLSKLLKRRHSVDADIRPGRFAWSCAAKSDHLAIEAAKLGGKPIQYLMQTSQAVDVILGGVKVNALPERVTVTVNHRINVGEQPELVWERITKLAEPLAKKYNISLNAFNGVKEAPLSISLWPSIMTLRPAPVTPTDTDKNTPYAVLAGTTRAVFGEHIIVAPGIMTGNTDTRHYWDLTQHIFRFAPGYDPDELNGGLGNIHTVDERISVKNHVGCVKWYTMFVRNMDEADLED